MPESPKSAPSGLDTSATPGKDAEDTDDNTGQEDGGGKASGGQDDDPLQKFEVEDAILTVEKPFLSMLIEMLWDGTAFSTISGKP